MRTRSAMIVVLGLLASRPAQAVVGPGQTDGLRLQLLDADGRPLPTFLHDGRSYVLGRVGERYVIHVENRTDARVEAVVSVDGLDVIRGRPASFRARGYVVPARGELDVDGFRLSSEDVAAFRFSSVPRSYAAQTGHPRNVGVIGVAIFSERERPEVRPPVAIVPPEPGRGETGRPGPGAPPAGAEVRARAPGQHSIEPSEQEPGLGTTFAERRASPSLETRFVRRDPDRPDRIIEVRYDDRAGLEALGIDVGASWDRARERREQAEPFPASRYAQPPPGWEAEPPTADR